MPSPGEGFEKGPEHVFGPAVTPDELAFVAALLERWQPPSAQKEK